MQEEASSLQPDLAGVFKRVARRYRDCGRFARHYVAAKLRSDPVHRDILVLAAGEAFGDVVDIGCGRGQLAVALLDAGLVRSVLGIDRKAGHLRQARHAANGLAFTSTVQDLAQCQDLPDATTVLLIDVLYQLEPRVQMALLQAAIRATRQRIIIRTLDPNRGLRSRVTVWLEMLARGVSPHSGRHVAARSVSCIVRTLDEAGFAASVTPCWQGTPFANVLIIGRLVS
jgi:SAM-dependent methyltransferase